LSASIVCWLLLLFLPHVQADNNSTIIIPSDDKILATIPVNNSKSGNSKGIQIKSEKYSINQFRDFDFSKTVKEDISSYNQIQNTNNQANSPGSFADSSAYYESLTNELLALVESENRFIDKLDSSTIISLPVGIKTELGGLEYTILINQVSFKPDGAYFDAYMSFEIPQSGKRLTFKGLNIPFSFSGGLKSDVRLELVSKIPVKFGDGITLEIQGNGGSYVIWDCYGFKKMGIAADIIFSEELIVPEDANGKIIKDKKVRCSFTTEMSNWNDLIVSLSLPAFQVAGVEGVGFTIENAVFDFSDSVVPQPLNWMISNGFGKVSATFAGKKVDRIIDVFAEVINKADSIIKTDHELLYNSILESNKYSISYSGTQHMRSIAGSSSPSNHSFGAAVDFRVKYNPQYEVGDPPFEAKLLECVINFRVNQGNKSNSIVRDKSLEFLRAIHGNNYPASVSNQTSIMRHYRIIRDNNTTVAALSGICDSAIVIQNFSNQRTDIISALNRHKSRAIFDVASITGIDSLVAHLNRVTGDTIPMKNDVNIAAFFTERSSFIAAVGKNNSINDFITYFETQANSNDRNKNKLFEDGFADIEPEVYEAFNKAHKLVCKRIMGKELPIEWGGNFNNKIDAMHFGLATEFVKYLTNQPIKE